MVYPLSDRYNNWQPSFIARWRTSHHLRSNGVAIFLHHRNELCINVCSSGRQIIKLSCVRQHNRARSLVITFILRFQLHEMGTAQMNKRCGWLHMYLFSFWTRNRSQSQSTISLRICSTRPNQCATCPEEISSFEIIPLRNHTLTRDQHHITSS